jgi:hypothetical protein
MKIFFTPRFLLNFGLVCFLIGIIVVIVLATFVAGTP